MTGGIVLISPSSNLLIMSVLVFVFHAAEHVPLLVTVTLYFLYSLAIFFSSDNCEILKFKCHKISAFQNLYKKWCIPECAVPYQIE